MRDTKVTIRTIFLDKIGCFICFYKNKITSLENSEGEDWWTVVSIVAKKNYDIDEALEEFEIKKETKRKRQEEKEKKEKKKTSKS